MGSILLLALAAAVYPQLLAVVVLILTRPNPRLLLWACYLGSLAVSVASGIAIFAVFRSRGTIAGESSRSLGPATYLVIGTIALIIASLMGTGRGRALTAGKLPRLPRRTPREPSEPGRVARLRSRADVALREGSLVVAGLAGAVLAVPGPFDFLALGRLARTGYGTIAAVAVILAFVVIKFLLIEVPIASYAIDPARTASRVDRFSLWMRANKLTIIAAVVAVIGLGLIVTGISNLP